MATDDKRNGFRLLLITIFRLTLYLTEIAILIFDMNYEKP